MLNFRPLALQAMGWRPVARRGVSKSTLRAGTQSHGSVDGSPGIHRPPLKQWVEKYNHHCLPKGFNHPNWVNHYFNGGGSPGEEDFPDF